VSDTEVDAAAGAPVIVLGAGHGTRLGGPKLFARHGGRTFGERILERCRETGARVILVSDPRFRARLEALLAELPAPLPRVVEADGTQPMLCSLRAGLRAGPCEPGFWLWPADAPFISPQGWRRAVAAAAGEPAAVWKLRAGGRSGHPIWMPAGLVPAILAGQWSDGLRGLLRQIPPGQIRVLELEGEFLEDIDTPEQLAKLDDSI
jgi:CTP:molybdopterin cytidylyltransferase MocA